MRLDPGCPLAARHLAEACFKKVAKGLLFIHRLIDKHIILLNSQRSFLQTLLDPRSLPMLRRSFALKLLAAGVLAAPALADGHSQYVFTTLNVSGWNATYAFDINYVGTIVGGFRNPPGNGNGFYWSGGAFTQVDYPGAAATGFWGINDSGVGVGRYDDASGITHGFVFSGGNITSVDFPGASSTVTRGINSMGNVVGIYLDAAG
jgi:hypothetical protein